jgi:hypothetical protein
LARTAASVRAQAISRMLEERRIATLVAFVRRLEALAQDDALDVLFALVSEMVAMSKGVRKKERFRTIKDLDGAALALNEGAAICCAACLRDCAAPNTESIGNAGAPCQPKPRPENSRWQV